MLRCLQRAELEHVEGFTACCAQVGSILHELCVWSERGPSERSTGHASLTAAQTANSSDAFRGQSWEEEGIQP